MIGVRGIYEEIVSAFGQPRSPTSTTDGPQAGKALAAERAERGRTPVLVIDEAHLLSTSSSRPSACSPTTPWTRTPRWPACLSASPPCGDDETRRPGRARATHRAALHHARHDRRRDQQLRHPPPQTRRPRRHPVHRRRHRLIHHTSRGYPRAVNNLALQSLVAAFAADKAIVDESSTRAAVTEVIDMITTPAPP